MGFDYLEFPKYKFTFVEMRGKRLLFPNGFMAILLYCSGMRIEG